MAITIGTEIGNMLTRCWIIAGATSTIAGAFARETAKQGHQLILLGRDTQKLSALQMDLRIRYHTLVDNIAFDAARMETYATVAASCMAFAKYPICLLAAFGVVLPTTAIEHTTSEVASIIQVNFTAVASVIYTFLPYFKAQSCGSILILGSVAGDRGRASNFDYGAAKAALVPFCEGLRAALLKNHVHVTLMKLGYIDTPMTYGKPGVFLAAQPTDCAKACLKAVCRKKFICYFPGFWRYLMFIVKLIPRVVMDHVKI